MNVAFLKKYLNTLPDNMQVMVQTCEGDYCATMELANLWQTEAFIDERYKHLERSKLVITAFVKGENNYETKNDGRGVMAIYPSETEAKEGA